MRSTFRYAVVAVLAGGAITFTAWTAAGNQTGPGSRGFLGYGDVHNYTANKMHVTYSLGKGSDRCDVWNYGGGISKEWKYAKCKQRPLAASGGATTHRKDADAFTFNYTAYYVHFKDRTDEKLKLNQGVWTKIQDSEVATCSWSQSLKAQLCTVQYDPSPHD